MNQSQYENLLELCAVLESGDYVQCPQRLRTKVGYCCLGVALNLVNADGWEWSELSESYNHLMGSYMAGYNELVDREFHKFGFLNSRAMEIYGFTPYDQLLLSKLNDRLEGFGIVINYIKENILTRYSRD